jgi:GNAT superfamily N-acetyltransferase
MRIQEIIKESINPDILNPKFKHKQTIGDYTFVANYLEEKDGPKLQITGFHDGNRIAEIKFAITNNALVSDISWIQKSYRGQGIGSTMYSYAKMLGNDIAPSKELTDQGKAMWKAYYKSGAAKHLVPKGFKKPDFDSDLSE